MTAPIETKPVVRLRLTNQHNHPIRGKLAVRLGELEIEYPEAACFRASRTEMDRREGDRRQCGCREYLSLELTFDAGKDGIARHEESMRVNFIARRTIHVDGKLDDWRGVLPQPIRVAGAGGPSFEEAMLFPFQRVQFAAIRGPGRRLRGPRRRLLLLRRQDRRQHAAGRHAIVSPHATRTPTSTPRCRMSRSTSAGRTVEPGEQATLREHRWPEGVRRFSYRRWPDIPSSMPQIARDNVLIAFNAIPMGEDGWETHLPGRMPKFVWYKSTDYEFALNKVADEYGGGTEIWRQWLPGMTYKHFYPRQPKSPQEGPAKGKLEIRYAPGTRIVECAHYRGARFPHVKQLRDAGKPRQVQFPREPRDARSRDGASRRPLRRRGPQPQLPSQLGPALAE